MVQPQGRQSPDFHELIQITERRDLDLIPAVGANMSSRLPVGAEGLKFIRISAIAKSTSMHRVGGERYFMEDVIAGLYGVKVPFVYLILGSSSRINVYLGVIEKLASKAAENRENVLPVLISTLQGTYPNIEIEILDDSAIKENIYAFLSSCRHYGVMTGIPSSKLGIEEYGVEQIERLIRGLYQESFGYMVVATPIEDGEVVAAFDDVTNQSRELSVFVKAMQQFVQTQRLTIAGESINRQAQYYIDLLEIILDKLKLAKALGLWETQAYFFSPERTTFAKMNSLLKVVFCGDKSFPEPVRTLSLVSPASVWGFRPIEVVLNYHPLTVTGRHPLERLMRYKYTTILNSRDLAILTHLPKEELPGYNVKETTRFGVHPLGDTQEPTINIGRIMDRGLSTGNDCLVKIKDMTKHGLIVGMTGTGKTNTIFHLLYQLYTKYGIPFMVIEPAKTEYRVLSRLPEFRDLQIFTLGDEMVAPFRLNPFEIMEGVQPQSHIDHLRAVFNASFIMYAPMPYVLERCIHEIYQDRGWDLIMGKNRRENVEPPEERLRIYPTLADLYEKIDLVVDRLGYEEKITMDVKAALKTRIGSLRIGGKGTMLDTPFSIPMEVLLSKPTILELHSIGDDEEKSFIIGLLLTRLYEFCEAERSGQSSNQKLKHITVIEEAHRLFTKTPPETGNLETVNIKAKAVETFCNILSEIRAYGEGIIIAEQIPSKLAPDAIKNSNIKIVHRMVAKDDREVVGSTMNLSEEQDHYLPLLKPGLAAVFYEGIDDPYLVKIPYFPEMVQQAPESIPSSEEILEFMKAKLDSLDRIYGRQRGCNLCQKKCHYWDMVQHIFEEPETLQKFSSYLLAILENKDFWVSKYGILKGYILAKAAKFYLLTDETEQLMRCFLVTAGNRFFSLKRQLYDLTIQEQNSLIDAYLGVLGMVLPIGENHILSQDAEKAIKQFQNRYRKLLEIPQGPFPGCDNFCRHKCLFRFEVQPFVSDKKIESQLISAIQSSREAVREFCMNVARQISLGEDPDFLEDIALCFFIQKSLAMAVKKVVDNIQKWFKIK